MMTVHCLQLIAEAPSVLAIDRRSPIRRRHEEEEDDDDDEEKDIDACKQG